MALIRGTANPLNVLGIRKLPNIPFHFAKTYTKNTIQLPQIDNWIYENLNSRYCVKKSHILDDDNKIIEVCEIGIEDPKDLTMLSLGCPFLHKN
jgi:hypothetical protein